MHPALHLLAPVALFVPAVAALAGGGPAASHGAAGLWPSEAGIIKPNGTIGPVVPLRPNLPPTAAGQVRIEQRVTIRISPRAAPMPFMPSALIEDDAPVGSSRIIERKMGKCLPLSSISGVAPAAKNRLVLLLRDNRVVRATLDKRCQGRDFYSGFLVARNADGLICTGRDELLARTGAKCKVSGYRQLIEQDD